MPAPVTHVTEAPLIEVFSSMQGEGVLVGVRQLFVRFAGCNLDCDYCDTLFAQALTCQVETSPGSGQYTELTNPVDLSAITSLISNWQLENSKLHHSLVLTGGEPLLHADLLKRWLPQVMPLLPVFLETNGTLPEELEKVLPMIGMVSMDIKGAAVTGAATPWRRHAEFISLARDSLCQVKLVVDAATPQEEIIEAARLVEQNAPQIPFILQPRTLATGPSLSGEVLLALQKVAASEHSDVRVIPQIHPWLGVA